MMTYNEHVQTCRAGKGPAPAAGSRAVSLIDDSYASAGLLAFVLQLRLEHAPARIEHGFGHPGFDEFQAAHIADEDVLILIDNLSRKLVQGIFAAPGGLPMQPFRLALVATALGLSDFVLDTPVELSGNELVPIARGRCLR
jgi:hypothetical protein